MPKYLVAAFLGSLMLPASAELLAQPVLFDKVKVRFSRVEGEKRRMHHEGADLIFDDAEAKLTVRSEDRPLAISYADVKKVVLEESRRPRGGVLGRAIGGALGEAIQAGIVTDYWFYLEYSKPDGTMEPYLLEIEKEAVAAVVEKIKAVFGERVLMVSFPERGEDIKKKDLKDRDSKHHAELDKTHHPLPENQPDKALVVVVCPLPSGPAGAGAGPQVKLHANDRVVAVNKIGTYAFNYLDPGEYLLASHSGNAHGFRMNLEAGRDYYFVEYIEPGTFLLRQSRELVMYDLTGSVHIDWKLKPEQASTR